MNVPKKLENWQYMHVNQTPGGGHLGIFWVGMCGLGLQIGTSF